MNFIIISPKYSLTVLKREYYPRQSFELDSLFFLLQTLISKEYLMLLILNVDFNEFEAYN